jgi:hypothetical protein
MVWGDHIFQFYPIQESGDEQRAQFITPCLIRPFFEDRSGNFSSRSGGLLRRLAPYFMGVEMNFFAASIFFTSV